MKILNMKRISYFGIILLLTINIFCGEQNNENKKANTKKNNNEENDTVQSPKVITNELKRFLADESFACGTTSLYVTDSLGNSLVAYNENISLIPASVLKLATTGAALEILGESRRFRTVIAYDGEIKSNHILHGNLYIYGEGDPTLGSKRMKGVEEGFLSNWVEAVKKVGIDSITGAIIADDTYFDTDYIPPTWSLGEIGDYYCTAASGISIFDNQFALTFNPRTKGKYRAKPNELAPYMPDFIFENKIRQGGSEDILTIGGSPYSFRRTIRGTVPNLNVQTTIVGSLPDPAFVAAYFFDQALRNKGIGTGKPCTSFRKLYEENDSLYKIVSSNNRQPIYTSFSPPLKDIVFYTNLASNNLFAEHLLNHIAIEKKQGNNTDAGVAVLKQFWYKAGIDTSGLYLFDGSGISRYNTITTKQLVQILRYMQKSETYTGFYNSLPIAGINGTLKYFARNTVAQGMIRAKSGSMSRVQSYAGYAKTKTGKTLCFAMMVNNFICTDKQARKKMEQVLVELISF